jgi:hypothetical protein
MKMPTRTFKPGDLVQYVRNHDNDGGLAIDFGSIAVVYEPRFKHSNRFLYVKWIKMIGNADQSDGGYYPDIFDLVIEDTFEKDGIE